ncbi:MAG: esterase [Prevotella sp.]|nr:MAG: esterase [Prevotella sp.]
MDIIKNFPALMQGKKLMYVHGFGSSAASGTVTLLRTLLPSAEVIAEDIPLHPAEGLEMLRTLCKTHQPDLIIGTSMGGMYTEMLRGYDRILINPALQMGDTMIKHDMLGRQTFQNPRKDGVQEFIVTKSLVNEYKDVTADVFAGLTPEDAARVIGLFGDEDDVVDTFNLFREQYPVAIRFHGGHRLTDKVALHYLIPVIRWIDDRQNGRERSIVYLEMSALADAFNKPRPSMHKAYELLIENYDVYIVAPAPTNHPEKVTQTQLWVEQYLNVPAYNRIVFTNRPALLYGDYFISSSVPEGFMGTSLLFGSSEFKTWEEVITYFDRLGGQ